MRLWNVLALLGAFGVSTGQSVDSTGSYPYFAEIELDAATRKPPQVGRIHQYGGVYIAKDVLLTGGDCTNTMYEFPGSVYVTVGRSRRNTSGGHRYVVKSTKDIVQYMPYDFLNGNLALVRLTPNGTGSAPVRVRLSRHDQPFAPGTVLTTMGYAQRGDKAHFDPHLSHLHSDNITVIADSECQKTVDGWFSFRHNNIHDIACFRGYHPIHGVCWKDTGAPLVSFTSQGPVVHAILKEHVGQCNGTTMTVRIAPYADWIDRTLRQWGLDTSNLWA